MSKWRPEEWENPCKRNLSFGRPDIPDMEHAFEAGADAMLDALRERAIPLEVKSSSLQGGEPTKIGWHYECRWCGHWLSSEDMKQKFCPYCLRGYK